MAQPPALLGHRFRAFLAPLPHRAGASAGSHRAAQSSSQTPYESVGASTGGGKSQQEIRNEKGTASLGENPSDNTIGSSQPAINKDFDMQSVKPDYTAIADPKNLNASTKPTPRQVNSMKELNKSVNNGVLRDDVTGEKMVASFQSQKGVKPPPNEVQVDHIQAVDNGGTRTMSNLELRTRENNREKSNQ